MKQIFLLLLAITIFSCGDDDEYGSPLVYTICGDELISDSDKVEQSDLQVAEWPSEIRSYVTSEFAGFSISALQSYKNAQGQEFFLATMNNEGVLLFDGANNFICGDESFSLASDDDEYIAYEDLPQKIKDFIAENYPNAEFDEAEFEDGEYEVKLKGDIELCFDQMGNFIGEC